MSYLKENNDPRLPVFAVRYVGAKGGPEQTPARASSDPKVQIGMPMGYNDVTINIGAASVMEGNSGLRNIVFPVTPVTGKAIPQPQASSAQGFQAVSRL